MAFEVKTGTISLTNSSGNEAFEGVGFQPKALMLYSTGAGLANTISFRQSFGLGTSATVRGFATAWSDNAVGTTNAQRDTNTNKILRIVDSITYLDLISLDSDGFTLNKSASPGAGIVVGYIAWGGSSLQAFVTGFNFETTNATQTLSGAGFQPTAALFIYTRTGAAAQADIGTLGFGMAATTGQAAMNWASLDNQAAATTHSSYATDACILGGSAAQEFRANLGSFTSDGLVLNIDDTSAANTVVTCLMLGGVEAAVVTDQQRTSTGLQSKNGVGFTPAFLLPAWTERTSTGYSSIDSKLSLGAASSASDVTSIWGGDVNGADPTSTGRSLSNSSVLQSITPNSSVLAQATLSSFDVDGYTLNWTIADSNARLFSALVMGEEGTVVPAGQYVTNMGGRGAGW